MTSKADKVRVTKQYDARIKITDEDKQEIKELYQRNISIHEISRRLSPISRRAIQFILFPERLEQLKKINKETEHYKRFYNKDKHTIAMRKHRARKKSLLEQGKIKAAIVIW